MEILAILERAKAEAWSDEEVVRRVRDGETALYEILMRPLQPAALPGGAVHPARR